MSLKELQRKTQELKKLFNKGDLDGCVKQLTAFKETSIKLPSLPPFLQKSKTQSQELATAREALELAVLLSIRRKDEVAFERNFNILRQYYVDARQLVQPSPEESNIMGLYLMMLLAKNRIADFHTELESLTPEMLKKPAVQFARQLELSLMEGTYNEILAAEQSGPNEYFKYFTSKLTSTVRDEIAACCEVAYESLRVEDAVKLLKVASPQDLQPYIEQHDWQLVDGVLRFPAAQQQNKSGENALPAAEIIENAVAYAREIERII